MWHLDIHNEDHEVRAATARDVALKNPLPPRNVTFAVMVTPLESAAWTTTAFLANFGSKSGDEIISGAGNAESGLREWGASPKRITSFQNPTVAAMIRRT